MLRKLGQNYQIALPRAFVTALRLHADDYLDIAIKDNKIVIEPQIMVPKSQAYFYTPEWQKDETDAGEDIKHNRTTKTKNVKELFKKFDE